MDAAKFLVEVIGPASQFTGAPSPAPAPAAAPVAAVASKNVKEAVEAYLDDIKGGVGDNTLADYRQYLRKLDCTTLADLTPEYAKSWLKTWEGKLTAQQHAMRSLSAFWNWCSESGWVKKADNPCTALDGVKRRLKRQKDKSKKSISVWTPEETEKVYRKVLELDPRIRGWFICCTWLGLRPLESMRVTKGDLHEDCLIIPPEKAKSSQGRFRTIEFTGPLEAVGRALQGVEWFKGSLVPWTDIKAPTRLVTAAAEACGAERGHDVLRHTCASYLSQLVGEQECSRMLGHSVEIEKGHYNARRTKAEAERFYGIRL